MIDLEEQMFAQKDFERRAFLQFAGLTVIDFVGYLVVMTLAYSDAIDTPNFVEVLSVGFTVISAIYIVLGWEILRPYFYNKQGISYRAIKRFHDKLRVSLLAQPKDLLGTCIDALNGGANLASVNQALCESFDGSTVEAFRELTRDGPIVFRLLDKHGKILASIPTV